MPSRSFKALCARHEYASIYMKLCQITREYNRDWYERKYCSIQLVYCDIVRYLVRPKPHHSSTENASIYWFRSVCIWSIDMIWDQKQKQFNVANCLIPCQIGVQLKDSTSLLQNICKDVISVHEFSKCIKKGVWYAFEKRCLRSIYFTHIPLLFPSLYYDIKRMSSDNAWPYHRNCLIRYTIPQYECIYHSPWEGPTRPQRQQRQRQRRRIRRRQQRRQQLWWPQQRRIHAYARNPWTPAMEHGGEISQPELWQPHYYIIPGSILKYVSAINYRSLFHSPSLSPTNSARSMWHACAICPDRTRIAILSMVYLPIWTFSAQHHSQMSTVENEPARLRLIRI